MGVRTIFAEICSRAKRWPVVGARFIAPNRRQVSVLCGGGVPHPRATARVPSPRPHRTRPYKDTEQLILLRRLCKGGSGVVRSGDPCVRPDNYQLLRVEAVEVSVARLSRATP